MKRPLWTPRCQFRLCDGLRLAERCGLGGPRGQIPEKRPGWRKDWRGTAEFCGTVCQQNSADLVITIAPTLSMRIIDVQEIEHGHGS